MPTELVLDVNVFMHASQPADDCFRHAVELLTRLQAHTACICVDIGYDADPKKNASKIWHEYVSCIRGSSFGYAVLHHLAKSMRIREKPKNAERAVHKKILQCISNKRDRVYVGVACATEDRMLVTEEHEDFCVATRRRLRKEVDLNVLHCCDVIGAF